MSKEAKDFKAEVVKLAKGRKPEEGLVFVSLAVFRPAKRGDLDNSIKVTLDSLKGIAFVDDAQVVELCAQRFDDKENPRVEVTIWPVEQPVQCKLRSTHP